VRRRFLPSLIEESEPRGGGDELAIIEAIADAEDDGEPGLDRVARAVVPHWSDDRYMRLLSGLHDASLIKVNAKGSPRVVQIRIVGTTYAGRSALQTARPTRVTIGRVLTPEERRDIDVFVRLLKAAIGEAKQHRPGPPTGRPRKQSRSFAPTWRP
jgi:hypothetical protein